MKRKTCSSQPLVEKQNKRAKCSKTTETAELAQELKDLNNMDCTWDTEEDDQHPEYGMDENGPTGLDDDDDESSSGSDHDDVDLESEDEEQDNEDESEFHAFCVASDSQLWETSYGRRIWKAITQGNRFCCGFLTAFFLNSGILGSSTRRERDVVAPMALSNQTTQVSDRSTTHR